MFGLFKPKQYSDSELGTLSRSRGLWRGMITLGTLSAPLALAGNADTPDMAALAAARDLRSRFPQLRSIIETSLFEHYQPYAQAVAAGEDLPLEGETFPNIENPAGVWPYATLTFVAISHMEGSLITELGFNTAWDIEHTLGIRFEGVRFVGMSGSTLAP